MINTMRRNVMVKCVMMVGILMQFVALTPHHHHEGQASACFNIVHCLGSGCDALIGNHHCAAHTQKDLPVEPIRDNCSLSDLVVVQPVRNDAECYCHAHDHSLQHIDLLMIELCGIAPVEALPMCYSTAHTIAIPYLAFVPGLYVAETGALRAPPCLA